MTGFANYENNLYKNYILEINTTEFSPKPILSNHQLLALIALLKKASPETEHQVISHNLHVVINIAKRYSDSGIQLMKLVSEGTMGLIHALKNFELEGGFRFASYAAKCVRQRIERTIMNQSLALSNSIKLKGITWATSQRIKRKTAVTATSVKKIIYKKASCNNFGSPGWRAQSEKAVG